MTPRNLIDDLRSRINPAYAATLGTESYERRLCAEALESLLAETDALAIGMETEMNEWTVWTDPEGKDRCAYVDCDGKAIAHVFSEDASERDKTAALIATAPDLLAVVIKFVAGGEKAGIKDFNIKYLPDARAAIARAMPNAALTERGAKEVEQTTG